MHRIGRLIQASIALTLALLLTTPSGAFAQALPSPTSQERGGHAMESLKSEIRHELVMLPYYSVFDWFEAEVQADGTVILNGAVRQPTLKKDAETKVARVEGVTRVSNNIDVLPLSNFDDDLRLRMYRAIYSSDSPLFKYAIQSVGPIHIIVNNGHVTLKGVVDSQADADIANVKAHGVSGAFEVRNELQVVKPDKPIS
jgi:hyperosmotically inducible periplasmic protein